MILMLHKLPENWKDKTRPPEPKRPAYPDARARRPETPIGRCRALLTPFPGLGSDVHRLRLRECRDPTDAAPSPEGDTSSEFGDFSRELAPNRIACHQQTSELPPLRDDCTSMCFHHGCVDSAVVPWTLSLGFSFPTLSP